MGDHFDTFKREIVIFKEPIKVINNVTSNNSYAGYGESSNQVEFTYVPVSGVFSGIVSYYEDQQSEFRFISDPGGLNSLYEGFYKNFSINNSGTVSVSDNANSPGSALSLQQSRGTVSIVNICKKMFIS